MNRALFCGLSGDCGKVNNQAVRFLVAVFSLVVLPAGAEDWTVYGQDYHHVIVTKVDHGVVAIEYDGGVGRIPITDLPPELQKRFGYTQEAEGDPVPAPTPAEGTTTTLLAMAPDVASPATTAADPAWDEAYVNQLNALGQQIHALCDDIANGRDTSQNAWNVLDAKIIDYEKRATASNVTNVLAATKATIFNMRRDEIVAARSFPDDLTNYHLLLGRLLFHPMPEVVALAKTEMQPISWKFTATDGSVVDFTNLRGKIVLIDFWAASCGPCCRELPDLMAFYGKYHDQGLEIVGVSLDQRRDLLFSVLGQYGMPWPEYYDGKGFDSDVMKNTGVTSVPTLWIVGRDGRLLTTNARQDLAGYLEKALKPSPVP